MANKVKVRLFEKRDCYIRYEIWEGKTKINGGWYKYPSHLTKGVIAKEILEMYFGRNNIKE